LSYIIHVYNLTKPEFQSNCFSSDKLYLKMTIPMIKPDNLIHYIQYILLQNHEPHEKTVANSGAPER
jgi:hypothetical protein